LGFTLNCVFYTIGSVATAALCEKVDRRLVIVGVYILNGIANFVTGPSIWFNMPDKLYIVMIGQAILGFAIGAAFATTVPEIKAGIDAKNFTKRQL
jgi:predicted MFS family arabinose efflux permease